MTSRIQRLDPTTASRIAAGEVIERFIVDLLGFVLSLSCCL